MIQAVDNILTLLFSVLQVFCNLANLALERGVLNKKRVIRIWVELDNSSGF